MITAEVTYKAPGVCGARDKNFADLEAFRAWLDGREYLPPARPDGPRQESESEPAAETPEAAEVRQAPARVPVRSRLRVLRPGGRGKEEP